MFLNSYDFVFRRASNSPIHRMSMCRHCKPAVVGCSSERLSVMEYKPLDNQNFSYNFAIAYHTMSTDSNHHKTMCRQNKVAYSSVAKQDCHPRIRLAMIW